MKQQGLSLSCDDDSKMMREFYEQFREIIQLYRDKKYAK